MGWGILGGGATSNTNETKNYIDSSSTTTSANQSYGNQSEGSGVSAVNSQVTTYTTATDLGAVAEVGKITTDALQKQLDSGKNALVFGGTALDVVSQAFKDALGAVSAGAGKSVDALSKITDQSARSTESAIGQAFTLAATAKAPDAANARMQLMVSGFVVAAVVVGMVVMGKNKK